MVAILAVVDRGSWDVSTEGIGRVQPLGLWGSWDEQCRKSRATKKKSGKAGSESDFESTKD